MDIYTETRPWGKFEKFHENQLCTVKLIYVNTNSRLSLQYHEHRMEFWKIVKGKAKVEIDEIEHIATENDNIIIPCGAKHRITALEDNCMILEISYGKFDENDIIRIEDDYNRLKKL
jgi:mannose-1-phosphate guanylyltransferase